jgi:spermidine/putrescine ABC transporter ATP-binding subunit
VVALDRTSLHVPAGALMALLGPSGCGKTTTLRLIAGFEAPDTGRILLGGRDLTRTPTHRRNLGMVAQSYSLFPHMTVGANIAFGLRMARVPRAERDSRVRQMLDLVQLEAMQDRFPSQLSGGQQQRVALARALVTSPGLLLLDEPLAALDKNLRETMQFELRRLQSRLGITTILVTHDQEEALTLADQVAVMNRGRVLQIGTPQEIYDFPRSRFVSEFLGTANLFEGTLEGNELSGPVRMCLPQTAIADFGAQQTVTVAVRPEKIRLSRQPWPDGHHLQAEVAGHVFRGAFHAYELRIPAHKALVVAYRQAQSRQDEGVFQTGDMVHIAWDPADAIVLPHSG